MDTNVIDNFSAMRRFYAEGHTRDVKFRKKYLSRLYDAIVSHEAEIASALYKDLHKSEQEAYISETSIVLTEIRYQLKHIERWSHGERKRSPLFLIPSCSRVIYEPKGLVLVFAPWNYPFLLSLNPLVGAVAAGNCVALKPSTTSSATCAVIKKIIEEVFPAGYVSVFDDDHKQADELLKLRFDHIFFTGGVSFGRNVMRAAAENLIPVTLELGGKSPCVVDRGADIDVAARRIVWGKLMNAGQTCIAPDYILVHQDLKRELTDKLIENIERLYGKDIKANPSYPRIISDKAFARLSGYLDGARIIYGGQTDAAIRYFAPTIIDSPAQDSPLMLEEIFGPIFPILTFTQTAQAIQFINGREKPLALYYFGKRKEGLDFLSQTTSGGACINDTIVHIANPRLPFGGIGHSGMGAYHGIDSFKTFSNNRGTIISPRKFDIAMRYPPYGKSFMFLKKLL